MNEDKGEISEGQSSSLKIDNTDYKITDTNPEGNSFTDLKKYEIIEPGHHSTANLSLDQSELPTMKIRRNASMNK